MKYSKAAMETFRDELPKKFINMSKYEELVEIVGTFQVNLDEKDQKIMQEFNFLKHQINDELSDTISREISRKLEQYDRVVDSFAKYLDSDQLEEILDQKIDQNTMH